MTNNEELRLSDENDRLRFIAVRDRAWQLEQRSQKAKTAMLTLAVGVSMLSIGLAISLGSNVQAKVSPGFIMALTFGPICASSAFGIPWFIERRKYMKNENDTFDQRISDEREYHAQALEKLKQASELTTLMQLNQDQIKTYHDIVTEQADKSFKSSRIAMGVGMFLLVCAAIGGAWVPLEQVRWFIGALAAFSTLLSGYLSRTYLTLYKESIGQLNRYFDQPVLNSYYLAAERLIGKLGVDHQDTVRRQIISEILTNSSRRGSTSTQLRDLKPKVAKPKARKSKKQAASVNGTPQA